MESVVHKVPAPCELYGSEAPHFELHRRLNCSTLSEEGVLKKNELMKSNGGWCVCVLH